MADQNNMVFWKLHRESKKDGYQYLNELMKLIYKVLHYHLRVIGFPYRYLQVLYD